MSLKVIKFQPIVVASKETTQSGKNDRSKECFSDKTDQLKRDLDQTPVSNNAALARISDKDMPETAECRYDRMHHRHNRS